MKLFVKIGKIMTVVAAVALLILFAVTVLNPGEVIDGPAGLVAMLCILVMVLFAIYLLIGFVVVVIDGWKQDKMHFLKEFVLQFIVAVVVVFLVHIMLQESEIVVWELLLSSVIMTCAVLTVEYIWKKYKNS